MASSQGLMSCVQLCYVYNGGHVLVSADVEMIQVDRRA